MIRYGLGIALVSLLPACTSPRPTNTTGKTTDAAPARQRSPAQPPAADVRFAVKSDIADCLDVVGKTTAYDGDLLLGVVDLKTTKITADCGCTSKWLLYRSVFVTDGLETEVASGSLLAAEPADPPIERRLVLLADREHLPARPITVHVGCAPAP